MVDPHLDTASQRPPTGLDVGARQLLLNVAVNLGASRNIVIAAFFHDRFGGPEDYYHALDQVWRDDRGGLLRMAVQNAEDGAGLSLRGVSSDDAAELTLLMGMPEPDFRLAITEALRAVARMEDAAQRINAICRNRVIPWTFDDQEGFQWVGDEEVETTAMRPALSAISDPRFAGGVKSHFDSARSELALGTPTALSQSVHQSGCAVESAMKAVLDDHNVAYADRATAQPLFNHMVTEGIVPRAMEHLVLGASAPRNQWGAHGSGATPHTVLMEEAAAVLASTAVATAYLHTLLT